MNYTDVLFIALSLSGDVVLCGGGGGSCPIRFVLAKFFVRILK